MSDQVHTINPTPEQWKIAADVYVQRIYDMTLCTDPADWDTAKKYISKLYELYEKKYDETCNITNWICLPSPLAAKNWILENRGEEFLNTNFYGNHESYWICFLQWATECCGVDLGEEKMELLDIWYNIAKSCCWWFAIDTNTVIICDRPKKVIVDDQYRTHAIPIIDDPSMNHETAEALEELASHFLIPKTEPSIQFRDDFKVYTYNGLYIDEEHHWFIDNPEQITVEKIDEENNAEYKRIMIEIFGHSNYVNNKNMTLVDADYIKVTNQPNSPSMPRFLLRSEDGDQFLVGTDGSTNRVYYMQVDPDTETCADAHNSISPIQENNILASS